jgi:hypothetical protein
MMPNHSQSLERLAELSRLLDKATEEYSQIDEESVRAKQTYEVSYARAFLDNTGSMELRKQIANYETRDENLEYELSAAKVRAVKERIRTLGTQIEVGRSLASAHKTQFAAESIGQYT